ncbi:MAG: hypothetical protein IJ146_11125 [Kiritimatiellae bacterium]|nr:hypothetical protein [Kiritimatiellia bacterium]
MNATLMARSLGFYIHVKRLSGVVKSDFERVDDYHDFLADIVSTAQGGAAFAGFGNDSPLIPLDEITLTQIQYGDIVGQIFSGVNFMVISIPHPAPLFPFVQSSVSYFSNYIESLEGGNGDLRTKTDVESIIERMNDILSVREANEQRVNGLVVGRVQSGKTRNYVGLMLKAVDEGWNVIIVLTSSNTALADQTERRVKKDFEKANVYMQTPLNFRDKDAAASPTHLLSPNNTSFYWAVAMKERNNLNNILTWLQYNAAIVPSMRIMIVDDEADYATPDSNTGKKTTLTEGEVDDLIAVVRDTEIDDKTFGYLADWMEDIQDRVFEIQEQAECDPGSREAMGIDALCTSLALSGDVKTKLHNILSTDAHCKLLELDEHAIDGTLVNLRQDVLVFFNEKGKGPRSAGTFLRFLNTVFEVAIERSAINRRICELIARKPNSTDYTFPFSRCAYIAYTATPYANILNERPDQTPLYADFIKSLTTSPKYFGLDKIFGRNYKKYPSVPNMAIVDEISDADKRFVLNPIQGIKDTEKKSVLEVALDDDLRYACSDPAQEGAWVSMRRAIAWAFCSAGARRRRRLAERLTDLDDCWTTMMLNVSPKQDAHDALLKHIKAYLGRRCSSLECKTLFLDECRSTWEYFTHDERTAYTKAKFDQSFNSDREEEYGEIDDYPSWDAIRDDVAYFINGWNDIRVHVLVVNSANDKNKDNQDRYNQTGNHANTLSEDHLWIVIGGNTIGRGLTLRGLTASYFDRVRKTVAVDTMTQMGRWFGYRIGYELLPRIWMPADTVLEMQKAAFVEGAMHESMKENFNEKHSPSDPAHYQKIYSWGRKLSGRARAQGTFMTSIGMLSTTDYISAKPDVVADIYDAALAFIGRLGPQAVRPESEYRLYREFPLWRDVDKNVVRDYLKSIVPLSPESARQTLRAIIREIEQTEETIHGSTKWSIVIGEPKSHSGESYPIGVDRRIFSGKPQGVKIEGDVARYTSVRSDMAFYSMIPTDRINYTDASLVERDMEDVIGTISNKTATNNGQMPQVIENALAAYPGSTLTDRIGALVSSVKNDPLTSVPPAIRDCLPEGFRNRSAIEYREEVYANAGYVQPILQFYLLTPPVGSTEKPLIAHAFYWPNHSPDDFNLVSIGMAPVTHNPSEQRFGSTVAEILSQNGFPMLVSKLKAAVLYALPECSEEFFNAHIKHPAPGIKYAKVHGKNAYYHTDWAIDPVAKIRQFVLERAAEILGDHQARACKDLAQTVLANNPALEGLFNPNSSQERNAVFADENLPQFGIVKNEDGTLQIQ